jgi:hypothetical protein
MSVAPTQAEEQFHAVTEQLTQWRQSRARVRGSRLPAALWSEMLQGAEGVSVPHVANLLRRNPQALQRRRGEPAVTCTTAAPQFVAVTPAAGQAGAGAVEGQRPAGARLRITYSESPPALAPLLQTFLEGR